MSNNDLDSKNLKSDLHMHPLGHKYYFSMACDFDEVKLDLNDKQSIREIVDWCYHDRGLNAIALTDHDMMQASLFAREYVAQEGLPIEIITGAECTVNDPKGNRIGGEVHLLCLGIDKLPKYDASTSVEKMIYAVHEIGGTVIMSHPIIYPESFPRYCHLLDGYEYKNSDYLDFDEGKKYVDQNGVQIQAYENSDYHYYGEFVRVDSPILHCNYYSDHPLK